ncbi:MAG TPA: hypothetical protein VGN07_07520 [Steroidobacteraceae bacterium]|jgi:hypothetical protein
MANVIDFLQRLGQDAQLRHAAGTQLEEALEQAEIDPAVRAAILADDRSQLEALLGATTNVCCLVRPSEEEDDDEGDEDDDFDDDDGDDEDDELTLQRAAAGCVAANG